jgi:XTP/dITP diphosphohydrolase
MKLWIATTNQDKVREMQQVLAPLGFEAVGLESIARALPEPVEDAPTFEGNARIKALAYARAVFSWGAEERASTFNSLCVAEDSGIEVDALGGAPGVHSARYAGSEGTRAQRDRANNAKLLAALAELGPVDRSARFVCAVCVVDAEARVLFEARGTCEGVIAPAPCGEGGFGYDPLLLLPDVGLTTAQLAPEAKHARSHRGQATRALAAWLAQHQRA